MSDDKDEREELSGDILPTGSRPHDEPAKADVASAAGAAGKDAMFAAQRMDDPVKSLAKSFTDPSRVAAAAEPLWMKAAQQRSALAFILKDSPAHQLFKATSALYKVGQSMPESPWGRFAKENPMVGGAWTKASFLGRALEDAFPAFNLAKSLAEPAWMKAVREHRSEFLDVVERIGRSAQLLYPVLEEVRKVQEQFTSRFSGVGGYWSSESERFAELSRYWESYPDRVRESLLVMGEHGWCLDFDMDISAPIRFREMVEEGRKEDACAEMVAYFESRVDSIKQEVMALYPKRRHIIESAFEAYANGQYVLAIPAIFAQIDGICLDVVNAHFFILKGRKKVRDHVMNIASDSTSSAFLVPFEMGMEVSLSERDRPAGFSGLNRHMVLHGESVDYGTKENCLKAISVLNYISQSIQRALDNEERNGPAPLVEEIAGQGLDS